MASIKNLKKDIDYVLGDIIDIVVLKGGDEKKSEALIEETFVTFDELISKIHTKNIENKKQHFKAIQVDLETKANALLEKANKL